jgi:hypothetical protein
MLMKDDSPKLREEIAGGVDKKIRFQMLQQLLALLCQGRKMGLRSPKQISTINIEYCVEILTQSYAKNRLNKIVLTPLQTTRANLLDTRPQRRPSRGSIRPS